MSASLDGAVTYRLPVGEEFVELNPLIGKTINLTHTGNIFCCSCGKKTKKSYSQGHCFAQEHGRQALKTELASQPIHFFFNAIGLGPQLSSVLY